MNKNVMRIVISLILTFVLVTSFVACGDKTTTGNQELAAAATDSTTAVTEKKEPIILTFSTLNNWGTSQTPVSIAISLYEKGTGNKIEQQLYPDDQFMNIMKTKLATGDVPDLFATYAQRNPNVPMDLLEPLDGSPWISQLRQGLEADCTRESDGKWVIAPVGSIAYLGAIYNKVVFKKAGVNLPLKNYSEFVAACEALLKIGVPPIQPANKDAAGFIWDFIGDHYVYEKNPDLARNIMENKLKPGDSPELVAAFQHIIDLKKYFKSDYAAATGMDGLKQVANGEVAMFANGSWCYGIMNKDFVEKLPNVGIMPISFGDDYGAVTRTNSGSGFAIPKVSKHKEEAKEFINFVVTPLIVSAIAEVSPGTYPLNIETKKSPWEAEMEGYIAQGFPIKNQTGSQYYPDFDCGSGWGDAVQAIIMGKPVKDALNENLYKKISDINKAKRTPGW